MKDHIVDQIRSYRDAHAKRFDYKLNAICKDLKKHQLLYKDRWAKLTPKKKKSRESGVS